MFVISTRNFPPEIGGMQNLIGGLANELVNHGPVTVFADKTDRQEEYDKVSKATIERFGGFKLFRKYRKANRISEFIKELTSISNVNKENLQPVVNNLIKKNDTNFKGVGQPIRIGLTGSKFGPGLYDIIMALGREEVLRRLAKIIS